LDKKPETEKEGKKRKLDEYQTNNDNEDVVDDDMAAVMGFSGFGGSKK